MTHLQYEAHASAMQPSRASEAFLQASPAV